jgi:hypothetical protein
MDLEGDETVMIQLSTQGYVVEGGTDEEYQSFNEGIIIFFTFLILFLHHNVYFYFLFFIFYFFYIGPLLYGVLELDEFSTFLF